MRQRGRKSSANLAVIPVNGDPPRLEAPSSLTNDERSLFTEIVAACAPTHFVASDVPILISFVQATLLSRQAVTKAAKDAGALALWEKATRLQATLATRLRLAPSSRVDPKTQARNQPLPFVRPWEKHG
jgi:hypothetical protein